MKDNLKLSKCAPSGKRNLTRFILSAAIATTLAGTHTVQALDGNIIPKQANAPILDKSGFLPDTEINPAKDGVLGPLLPMHTASAHNTLVWKRGEELPGMLMFNQYAAYRADEIASPAVIRFLINTPDPATNLTVLLNPAVQLSSSIRQTFQQFVYGGNNIDQDAGQSVVTRIEADQTRELTQLWDLNHPDAFKSSFGAPIHSAALLNNSDAELNIAAFKNTGSSKGLHYDMHYPGFATLEDGRAVFAGGLDINNQSGLYRTQVYDPDLESWANRPVSCMRDLFGSDPSDPYFEKFYQAEIERLTAAGLPSAEIYKLYLPECDPQAFGADVYSKTPGYEQIRLLGENGTVTQPGKLPSDMRYARSYPAQIALPGNRLLIYSGWDLAASGSKFKDLKAPATDTTLAFDSSTLALAPFFEAKALNPELYPDLPAAAYFSGYLKTSEDTGLISSFVKQPVPEIYDGTRDTMTALENARLFTGSLYPNGLVIQTGPGRNDWKVGLNDGKLLEDVPYGVTDSSLPASEFHNMWLLDVQGALKDKAVNTPQVREGKYLELLSEAANSHTAFTGSSNVMKLDKLGNVITHKLTHFGGLNAVAGISADIEQISFEGLSKAVAKKSQTPADAPAWKVLAPKLYQPGVQNYATPLPDGTTVLLGGTGGNLPGVEAWSLHLQHFIPSDSDSPLAISADAQGKPGIDQSTKLAKSLIPHDEQGIIQLMPDGRIYLGGQSKNSLKLAGDFPATPGDSDLAVPSGQLFSPPYLFDPATGQLAERPVILKGPDTVTYGKPFTVSAFTKKGIKAVSLIRTGSTSHSLNTDVRYVKVEFKAGKVDDNNLVKLTVFPPKLPATAVGGYYYLFILDNAGVPSIAKVTVVGTEIDKRVKALKKADLLTASVTGFAAPIVK